LVFHDLSILKSGISIATSLLDFDNRFHHERYARTDEATKYWIENATHFEARFTIDGYASKSLVQDKAGRARETQSGASMPLSRAVFCMQRIDIDVDQMYMTNESSKQKAGESLQPFV
jgi:hypothetical protein